MRIVLSHHRNNIHTGLDRQMERALLERQQLRFLRVTPRSLGEDEHALLLGLHLPRRTVERLDSRLTVRAIDEHGAGQRHEPPQEGHPLQRLLRRDAAVRREDGAQHQHVQLGLVVPDEDGGAGAQVLLALDDLELHAGRVPHHPLEAARRGPLRHAAVPGEAEDDGGDDAVGRAEEEGAVRGEAARREGGPGHLDGDGEEGEGHDHVGRDSREDVRADGHDCGGGADERCRSCRDGGEEELAESRRLQGLIHGFPILSMGDGQKTLFGREKRNEKKLPYCIVYPRNPPAQASKRPSESKKVVTVGRRLDREN